MVVDQDPITLLSMWWVVATTEFHPHHKDHWLLISAPLTSLSFIMVLPHLLLLLFPPVPGASNHHSVLSTNAPPHVPAALPCTPLTSITTILNNTVF
jgi:hypothetical protein